MRCCNNPSTALPLPTPDPSLRVNYTKGMILGVDDYVQEHAYLSGRDQWMVQGLIGYGTSCGLAVHIEDTADGPRIQVSQGAAALPSGKLVGVTSDQCGVINAWLAKAETATEILRLLPGGSPPTSPPTSPPVGPVVVSLYLTLCYADCQTALVPIPGEPCRSDESLMAPSRIADDYLLALRLMPPRQTEEDAVRDFADWLSRVPVTDVTSSPPADEKTWIAALRAAGQPWFAAFSASPPTSAATLGDFLFGSPPAGLAVGRADFGRFLRAAFRFWVTELKPMWSKRCGGPLSADDDCVLLARLEVPIIWVGGAPTGVWQVSGTASAITVDESRRPYLAHLRLVQEWLMMASLVRGG